MTHGCESSRRTLFVARAISPLASPSLPTCPITYMDCHPSQAHLQETRDLPSQLTSAPVLVPL